MIYLQLRECGLSHPVVADFVKSVSNSTGSVDRAALVRACRGWTADELVTLLSTGNLETVRAAVLGLSVTGGISHTNELVRLLGHPNRVLVELVEDSLWSIWMRAGSANANHLLTDAVQCIDQQRLFDADQILRELVATEPEFAEPHHQRGIVQTLLERYETATRAFLAALHWNPHHYSAAANLGHVLVARDDYHGALDAYQRALRIHPNLSEVAEAAATLRKLLQVAS